MEQGRLGTTEPDLRRAAGRSAQKPGSSDPVLRAVRARTRRPWTTRKTRSRGPPEDRARGLVEARARSRQPGANAERRRSVHYLVDGGDKRRCASGERTCVSADVRVGVHALTARLVD